jgi:hypothetical protein
VKLRSRKLTCAACGVEGQRIGSIEETDYVAFCGGARPNWLERGLEAGRPESRIYVKELKSIIESEEKHTIIDVRPRTEFGICRLPSSTSECFPAQRLSLSHKHIQASHLTFSWLTQRHTFPQTRHVRCLLSAD